MKSIILLSFLMTGFAWGFIMALISVLLIPKVFVYISLLCATLLFILNVMLKLNFIK